MHNLRTVLTAANLISDTSKKAYAGLALAAVLLFFPPSVNLTPDQTQDLQKQFNLMADQVAGIIVIATSFIAALSKILATYHGIVSAINLFHNEDKHANLPVVTTERTN